VLLAFLADPNIAVVVGNVLFAVEYRACIARDASISSCAARETVTLGTTIDIVADSLRWVIQARTPERRSQKWALNDAGFVTPERLVKVAVAARHTS
jgi:hypothetical protein